MFDVIGPRQSSNCCGSRRDFLKVGALGTTGLALPNLLRARAAQGSPAGRTPEKTVIWLFLSGGPTHYETFDPKPNNPLPYRSTVGTISITCTPTAPPGWAPRIRRCTCAEMPRRA